MIEVMVDYQKLTGKDKEMVEKWFNRKRLSLSCVYNYTDQDYKDCCLEYLKDSDKDSYIIRTR